MLPSLESKGEREFCSDVRALGYWTCKLWGFNQVGIPDRVVIGPDRFVLFIEFKRPGFEPSRKQAKRLRTLSSWGFAAYYADSKEHARAIFDAVRAS